MRLLKMKFWPAALLLASGAAASAVIDRPLVAPDNEVNLFASHPHQDAADSSGAAPAPRRIPSSAESAVLARRILALTPFGTIATVFPHGASSGPPGSAGSVSLGGLPIGLPEYLADCEGDSGNPTLLAITIATSFRNARAGSNVSLALQWEPPYAPAQRLSVLEGLQSALGLRPSSGHAGAGAPSAAALPRYSLLGYLEPIPGQKAPTSDLASCFVKTHPDARWWLPGSPVHKSEWLRLVVTNVYWIGGFGDRAYIGWIPVEEWRNVTRADWEKVRLPGEQKGWKESAVGYDL